MAVSMELPPSAVELLRSTYSSVTHHLKLNHKQRRKLWKRQKRRKRRIINFFAENALKEDTCSQTTSSEDDISNSDLPVGPLTNYAVICHLRTLQLTKNSSDERSGKGILKNTGNSKVSGFPTSMKVISEQKTVADGVSSVASHQQSSALGEDSCTVNGISVIKESDETDQNDAIDRMERPQEDRNEIQNLLDLLDEEVERWQNPPAPPDLELPEITEDPSLNVRTTAPEEKVFDDRPLCSFYSKVGVCRFGIKCSRKHQDVDVSDTLLFPNMFQPFMFELEDKSKVNGDAHDLSLEHSEQDLFEEYLDFYADIEPEFEAAGKVMHLYVCLNRVRHLRGNVYVQYEGVESATKCYNKMLGRYYNGKPLYCKYVSISSWNEAICGLYYRRDSCPRGGQCNFLHTFKRKPQFVSHKGHKFNIENGHQRSQYRRKRWNDHEYKSRRSSWSRRRSYSSDEERRFRGRRHYGKSSHDRDSSKSWSRSPSSSPQYRSKHRSRRHKRSRRSFSHDKKSRSRSKSRNASTTWVEKEQHSLGPDGENQSTSQSFIPIVGIVKTCTRPSQFDSSLNAKSKGLSLNKESESLCTADMSREPVDSDDLPKGGRKHKKKKKKHKRIISIKSGMENG